VSGGRKNADLKVHVGEILQLNVVDHQDMFVELGQALMKRELWDRALDCFASINEEDSVSYSPTFSVPLLSFYHKFATSGES
jgi:general transcription factor 3C polypeptide 3 (transcription factor C subunit 4)